MFTHHSRGYCIKLEISASWRHHEHGNSFNQIAFGQGFEDTIEVNTATPAYNGDPANNRFPQSQSG